MQNTRIFYAAIELAWHQHKQSPLTNRQGPSWATGHMLPSTLCTLKAQWPTTKHLSWTVVKTARHLLEFIRQAEQTKQLNVPHGGFEVAVEGCQGCIGDVVVAGNAAQVRHLEVTGASVVPEITSIMRGWIITNHAGMNTRAAEGMAGQ